MTSIQNLKIIKQIVGIKNQLLVLMFVFFSVFAFASPKVLMETNIGDIEIELDTEHAPITTENFINYVMSGYYDGLIFHRVIPNFMVQGGGFDDQMIQKNTNSPIKNEANNGLKNDRGTIAMARTSVVDSATSQFFINVVNNDFLNYKSPNNYGYAVFGKVTKGMDVVDKIVSVQTETKGVYQNVPVSPIYIKKAIVMKESTE